ncbi:DUF305 domain-containing protein [soil metagenome]
MENKENMQKMQGMSYKKFSLMMLISFIIMYGVMFLNVDEANHVYISTTRTYMAVLMVSPMAILMMLMMGKMYPHKKLNTGIMLGAVVLFALVLTGLRTQTPISDVQYMKAMIPHHSSAILVSKNANLKDPEVIKLSEGIIASQEKEIAEMKAILARMEK